MPSRTSGWRSSSPRQPVFFVATAPCLTPDGEGGHVNLSPKGYKDRITIMFCSFETAGGRGSQGLRARLPKLAACGSR